MHFLFAEHPRGVRAGAVDFFSILLRVRLALGMPALVLQQGDDVLGCAMGYDTSRPAWPASLAAEWSRFKDETPGFATRLTAYETICEEHEPREAHYYLGVIGVHPSLQGQGAGRALLEAFCAPSRTDPKSCGVFLETASESSLRFYYRNGFDLHGAGRLDATPLWCLYQPT